MVDRFERFSVAIAEISRYWHKIASKEMERRGLRGVHSIYLTALYRHPEGLTAGQLCELCGRDKADASRMLSIMEKRGMVRKEGGHRNLYGGKLKLTDEGVAAAEFVCRRASLAVELAGSALDESARDSVRIAGTDRVQPARNRAKRPAGFFAGRCGFAAKERPKPL